MEIQTVTEHLSGFMGGFSKLTVENILALGKAFTENDITLTVKPNELDDLDLYANDILVCSNRSYDEVALNIKLLMDDEYFELFSEETADSNFYYINIDEVELPSQVSFRISDNGFLTRLTFETWVGAKCKDATCEYVASLDIVDWDVECPENLIKNFAKSLNGFAKSLNSDVWPADEVNFQFVEDYKDIEPLLINIPLDGRSMHLFRGTKAIASVHCDDIDSQLPEFFHTLNEQLGQEQD
jgi:hypothetical protein